MRAVIILGLVQAVFCASISERSKDDCNFICAAVYDPVCGTDGITYSSTCQLGAATCKDSTVILAHKGRCGGVNVGRSTDCQMMCIALYDPVCGNNGKTYGNSCNLGVASCMDSTITLAHKGACGGMDLIAS